MRKKTIEVNVADGLNSQLVTFAIDEITCVSYSQYRPYIRYVTLALALSNLVFLGSLSAKLGFLGAIIFVVIAWKVFSDSGEIVTTGGRRELSSNWSEFNTIAETYKKGALSKVLIIKGRSIGREYYHIINPKNIAMISSDMVYHNGGILGFSFALLVFGGLSFNFDTNIIVASLLMGIIGWLALKSGVEISSSGQAEVFLELSTLKKSGLITAVQRAMNGESFEDINL